MRQSKKSATSWKSTRSIADGWMSVIPVTMRGVAVSKISDECELETHFSPLGTSFYNAHAWQGGGVYEKNLRPSLLARKSTYGTLQVLDTSTGEWRLQTWVGGEVFPLQSLQVQIRGFSAPRIEFQSSRLALPSCTAENRLSPSIPGPFDLLGTSIRA